MLVLFRCATKPEENTIVLNDMQSTIVEQGSPSQRV